MRWRDEDTLDRFRGPGACEGCGHYCHSLDAHHAIITRGAGGPDVPENLMALGRLCCHTRADERLVRKHLHDVLIQRLWREARSTRFTLQQVKEYLWLIIRLPKGSELPRPSWQKEKAG